MDDAAGLRRDDGGVITISVESDEEHQAVDEALAAGRLGFGSHGFVIKRECRPGPGGSAGVTVSVAGGNGGGASPVQGGSWQMPQNVHSPSEAAWRNLDEIRAMES